MTFIYQYKKILYFNLQKNQNLHELLYIYIIYIYIYTKTNLVNSGAYPLQELFFSKLIG